MNEGYKNFQDNYDSINWAGPSPPEAPIVPVISPESFKSCLQQIAEEKRDALQAASTSISTAITLLYETEGLLAWTTRCPAKDRRDVLDVIDERLNQIKTEIIDLIININVIQKP